MRRAANDVLKTIKDQVRGVRYSIRAEAEAPGSTLPKALHDLGGPFMAIGNPALRLADGLFTEVETIATDLLAPAGSLDPGFPRPVRAYLDRSVSLSDQLYAPYKEILAGQGVRAMLVSEQQLDRAGERFRDREGDGFPLDGTQSAAEIVKAAASLACALAEARPIRKLTFGERTRQTFMLAPNQYCAMVVGIAAALVSLKPELADDPQTVLDSAGSVTDVRFHRFKRALLSKAPEASLAKEFEVLLPFLP